MGGPHTDKRPWRRSGVLLSCLALAAGCAGDPIVLDGRAVSMRYDPNRVAGLPVTDGPTAYCTDNNTVEVDLDRLPDIGTPASESQQVLLQGDNSAISVVTSRYMQAIQQQRADVSVQRHGSLLLHGLSRPASWSGC